MPPAFAFVPRLFTGTCRISTEPWIASGVAYPSDWETAHIGATLMVALMMQKPEFRADFQAVKTEIRKDLGLSS
jgi:hypothetical protein